MRTKRAFPQVVKRIYHPELKYCLECQSRLERCCTVSQRTVVTLSQVVRIIRCGYRCPHPTCPGRPRLYRSGQADALALPGFTFGLDIVLLVGQLRLSRHQTVDEIHRELVERLAPLHQTISRREILFLFEVYAALLRAGTEVAQDQEWRDVAQLNGSLLLSIDGIQPDKGNETIYLVRDLLTGRLLTAENVTSSIKETIKRVLAPVVALELPILGMISDAQESQLQAVAELWPGTPHQICQFHAIKEAGRLIYVLDHRIKTDMRIRMQQKTHEDRQDLSRRRQQAQGEEASQLAILDEYAATTLGTLNLDSTAPFAYAGLAMEEGLRAYPRQLGAAGKKGVAVTPTCQKRLKRLKAIVSLYEEKREALSQVRAMREWVMRLEHILDGSWASSPEEISNAEVACRFDGWLKDLTSFLQAEGRTQEEQLRLGHLLKVMSHLRPGLVQCYDLPGFPRTNNDLEISIRALKTRYRRISGRKNWNVYLLRYGRCVAYYEWWMQQPNGPARVLARLRQTAPHLWRAVRQQTRDRHREQLNRFRFRHHPQAYLASLEQRWEQAACT